MDATKLKYFIYIVNNGFNLSLAAKKLYLSQPALSKVIGEFEHSNNIVLFERKRGRLTGLTAAGKKIYEKGVHIISEMDKLDTIIKDHSQIKEGRVVLGIPPVVITALFTDLIHEISFNNPLLDLAILERGSFSLSTSLTNKKLNYSILIEPTKLDEKEFEIIRLEQDSISMYCSKNHPLAKKASIDWEDLEDQDVVIIDKSFGMHHLVVDNLKKRSVTPKLLTSSKLTQSLFSQIQKNNFISVLPNPTKGIFNMDGIVIVPFTEPVEWSVVLVYRKNTEYTPLEQIVLSSIKKKFQKKIVK